MAEDVVVDPGAQKSESGADDLEHVALIRRKQGETSLFRVPVARKPFGGMHESAVDKHYTRPSLLDDDGGAGVGAAVSDAASGGTGRAVVGRLDRGNSIGHLQPGRGASVGITKEQLLASSDNERDDGAGPDGDAAGRLAAAREAASHGSTQHTGLG